MYNLFTPLIHRLSGHSVKPQNLGFSIDEIASAIILGSDLSSNESEVLLIGEGVNMSRICDLLQSSLDQKVLGKFSITPCDNMYLNADAALLLKKSDCVILVESKNESYISEIDRKIKTIGLIGVSILGFVLVE